MFNTATTAGMMAGRVFGTYLYENFRCKDFPVGPITRWPAAEYRFSSTPFLG